MKTIVSEKGQITIPKRLRHQLGLKPGVVIEFASEGGKLVGRKQSAEEPLLRWLGKGTGAATTDSYLKSIRNR